MSDFSKYNNECLAKAEPDEPIFVLRAQDKFSIPLIRLWMDLALLNGCPPNKLESARRTFDEMYHWQKQTGRAKYPD
jgi:hypothetical protein